MAFEHLKMASAKQLGILVIKGNRGSIYWIS